MESDLKLDDCVEIKMKRILSILLHIWPWVTISIVGFGIYELLMKFFLMSYMERGLLQSSDR